MGGWRTTWLGLRVVLAVAVLVSASACVTGSTRARSRDATIARLTSQLSSAQQRVAALELDLEARDRDVQTARSEVRAMRQAEASRAALRDGSGRAGQSDSERGELASLRNELQAERQRRQALEAELERLRRETASPFGDQRVPEADYLALKQELVELRRSANQDRQARDRLAAQIEALQRADSPPLSRSDDPTQRAQMESLQREKDQIIASLNKNLEASQRRAAELEDALTAARQTGAADGSLRDENASLRARLDDERRRTEDLEAKLKVASRITDLIFRMQGQQGNAAPARR